MVKPRLPISTDQIITLTLNNRNVFCLFRRIRFNCDKACQQFGCGMAREQRRNQWLNQTSAPIMRKQVAPLLEIMGLRNAPLRLDRSLILVETHVSSRALFFARKLQQFLAKSHIGWRAVGGVAIKHQQEFHPASLHIFSELGQGIVASQRTATSQWRPIMNRFASIAQLGIDRGDQSMHFFGLARTCHNDRMPRTRLGFGKLLASVIVALFLQVRSQNLQKFLFGGIQTRSRLATSGTYQVGQVRDQCRYGTWTSGQAVISLGASYRKGGLYGIKTGHAFRAGSITQITKLTHQCQMPWPLVQQVGVNRHNHISANLLGCIVKHRMRLKGLAKRQSIPLQPTVGGQRLVLVPPGAGIFLQEALNQIALCGRGNKPGYQTNGRTLVALVQNSQRFLQTTLAIFPTGRVTFKIQRVFAIRVIHAQNRSLREHIGSSRHTLGRTRQRRMLRIGFNLDGTTFVALHQNRCRVATQCHRSRIVLGPARLRAFGFTNVRHNQTGRLTTTSRPSQR